MSMLISVVPYIGTWIETFPRAFSHRQHPVVPYIGTWIETYTGDPHSEPFVASYLI